MDSFIISGSLDAMLNGDALALISFVELVNGAPKSNDADDEVVIAVAAAAVLACAPQKIRRPRSLGKLIKRQTIDDLALTLNATTFKRK